MLNRPIHIFTQVQSNKISKVKPSRTLVGTVQFLLLLLLYFCWRRPDLGLIIFGLINVRIVENAKFENRTWLI